MIRKQEGIRMSPTSGKEISLYRAQAEQGMLRAVAPEGQSSRSLPCSGGGTQEAREPLKFSPTEMPAFALVPQICLGTEGHTENRSLVCQQEGPRVTFKQEGPGFSGFSDSWGSSAWGDHGALRKAW